MIDDIVAGVLAVKAVAMVNNVMANGSDMKAKRIIRACNVVLQSIEDQRHEALFCSETKSNKISAL